MGELDVRREAKADTAVEEADVEQNPGRTALTDLEVDGVDSDGDIDIDVTTDAPNKTDLDQRRKDRETIATAEQKLVALIENPKVAIAQRKTALRDLLCAQRGIDYPRLAAADPTKAAIHKEVEDRFALILQGQIDEAKRKKLDATIDNTKLSREARLQAFYEEYLLDRGIRDVAKKPGDEQAKLRGAFEEAGGVARFDLRDQITRDNAKQRAIVNNRKNPAKARLAAFHALYRNQASMAAGVAWAAMKPDQQSAIDARFQAEIVPQFEAAEVAAQKRAANESKAKALETQLRPVTETLTRSWGRFTKVTVPERADVFRQIMVLRTGRAASDPLIEKKVAEYRRRVAKQNAEAKRQASAWYYYERGVNAMNAVNKDDINRLWSHVTFEARDGAVYTLADAMFGGETHGVLIAVSQQAPIRIRAGALLHGGESEATVATLIATRGAKIRDLTKPIVLLTDDVMSHYLEKVLTTAARNLLSGDDTADLMEAVLGAYKKDIAAGTYEAGESFDDQMKIAKSALGDNPVTVDGAPIDLGDKNSQGATVSWTAAKNMNKPIEEAQASVDEQQKKVDEIKAYQKQESERRQKEQLDKLKDNPRLLNLVGTGPGYTDPRLAEAEQELEKRKALLARRQQVKQSFTDQAMDLKFGNTTVDKIQLDLAAKLKVTDEQIGKYEQQLSQARIDATRQRESVKITEESGGFSGEGGSGARGGMAIVTADAERKVTELEEHLQALREQRGELTSYVSDASSGALPPPIRLKELQTKLDTGYRFVPSIERWGRAVLAGAEEAGAFVTRVFAGLVDVSIPGIIEHGGNQVLSLLGSDARVNLGIGVATSNMRSAATWLETNAQYQMEQTGGGLDVEIIKGLTTAAILYLPTMGFGSVGAAVGGAIRATQMARLLGTSVSLGTMGALASLDKGPGDMARGVVPMMALPMFGAAFKSVGGRLIAGFFSNMTSDVLVSADYAAALAIMKKGGNLDAAIQAAGKSVNWNRAIAQGLIGVAQEAHGIVQQQSSTTLAEDGMPVVVRESPDGTSPHEYYRYASEGGKGEWVKVDAKQGLAQAAKHQRPPVRVTEGELGVIIKGGDPAMQALQVAESRSKQVDMWGAEAKTKEDQIAALDRKVGDKTADAELRTQLTGELQRAEANETMMRLSEKQQDIDAAVVEKAGQAPPGYVLDATTKQWKYSGDVAQKQLAAKTAELNAVENARAVYEGELAALYRLRDQMQKAKGNKAKAAEIDQQISAQAAKIKAAQQTYLAVGGDPALVKEVSQARQELVRATEQAQKTTAKTEERAAVVEKPKELATKPIPDDAKPWIEAEDGRQIFKRADETFVDQNGRVTDADGTLIDAAGNWVDAYGRRVDGASRLIDAEGNLINEAGQKIDKTGKVIAGTGEKASQSERELITDAFKKKFGDKVIAYRGIRVPKGAKVEGKYEGGSGHGQMIVFDAESALHYAKNPAFDPPAGFAEANEIVIIQFEVTADLIVHDPYVFEQPMHHVFVGNGTDITTLPGYKASRFPLDTVTSESMGKLAAQIENKPLVPATSGGGLGDSNPTVTESVPTSRTRGESTELPPPDQRPPGMDDEIISGIAKRGEAWANNIMEGTCASAAMKNTISAQIAGLDAYVMEFQGLSGVGRMLERFNLSGGKLQSMLEKAGVELRGAHAIAAIKGTDGAWRYLSWGRVELDWQVFAREAYGDSYELRGSGTDGKIGEWTTGDHVRWMVAHRWEYPSPTRFGKIMRALVGWSIRTGK